MLLETRNVANLFLNAFSSDKRENLEFASRYGSRSSNKFHQIKVLNFKKTKNGQCFGTVRFALLRKNHGKRSKKYGTLRGRPKRSLTENGRVRYGTDTVDG